MDAEKQCLKQSIILLNKLLEERDEDDEIHKMTEKEQKAELLRVKYHRENLELKEQVKELT